MSCCRTYPELAHTIAAYPWVADGLTETGWQNAAIAIRRLTELAQAAPGLAQTIAAYPWVADGLTENEAAALYQIGGRLRELAQTDPEMAQAVAGHSWLVNRPGDAGERNEANVVNLLELLHQTEPVIAQQINDYSWPADGIADYAANALRQVLSLPEANLPLAITAYPWIADGLTIQEGDDLHRLAGLLRYFARTDPELAGIIAGHRWLAAGITETLWENTWNTAYQLNQLAEEDAALARAIAAYGWIDDGLTGDEVRGFRYIIAIMQYAAETGPGLANEIAAYDWIADGLDDYELAFLSVLKVAGKRSAPRFADLLEAHHTRSAVVALPLAGEVELLVFRHSPFPEDDDSIELMQEIIPVLERFMDVPFPRRQVVLWVMEPSLREGENPPWIRGFAGQDVLGLNTSNFQVFHEVAHVYWGGQTGAHSWFIEGAAELLADYARDFSGEQSIEERRAVLLPQIERDCIQHGVNNIRQLLALEQDNLEEYDERELCKYRLGELFHMEIYRLLGHDAASAALRQLYVDGEKAGWGITEEQIYQVFLDNAPEEQQSAFHELYCRLHGDIHICGE